MNRLPLFSISLLLLFSGCKKESMIVQTSPKAESGHAEHASHASPTKEYSQKKTPQWDAPEHWVLLAQKAMQIAAYEIKSEQLSGTLSISSFPGDVGGKLANVNRWLAQIQLQAISEQELEAVCSNIQINNTPAYAFEAQNEELAIYAIALKVDNQTCFFKFRGSKELLEMERDNIDAFVQSTRF